MYARALLLCVAVLLASVHASWMKRSQDIETATWTKPGARYRSREVTYIPETTIVTEAGTTIPTVTLQLRSASTHRNIRRAFLNNWSLQGCASDDDRIPPLTVPFDYQLAAEDVSSASCNHFCDQRGDTLAALINGNECYCGKAADGIEYVDLGACNVPCAAQPGEMCGGTNVLSIYKKA